MTMQWIAGQTVGAGNAASITFSNIPQTFTHLQIRSFARTDAAIVSSNISFQFNNDTGTNYSRHVLQGDGSTTTSAAAASTNVGALGTIVGTSTTSGVFGIGICDILDYANTNKNKVTRDIRGFDNNGSGIAALYSTAWYNTNAITTIYIFPNFVGNFVQYSRFDLYGITTSELTGA